MSKLDLHSTKRYWIRWFLFNGHYLWQDILQFWATKHLGKVPIGSNEPLPSRVAFKIKNKKLQEEIWNIFAQYGFCKESYDNYCNHIYAPFSAVDCILYGIDPHGIIRYERNDLLKTIIRIYALPLRLVFRKFVRYKQSSREDIENIPKLEHDCPELSTNGCLLALGERPMICINSSTGEFDFISSWHDYWRYFWATARYLVHLTLSLKAVLAEWSQKKGFSQAAVLL